MARATVYFDRQGLAYELTGETRQVSGGEYYLENGEVRICTRLACVTDEAWPVLVRVAASSEIDRLEAENVRLTQANRIATDVTLQAIDRANVAEKALAEARAALVEIATSSRSSGESALARAALDAARKDEKDD